MKDNSIFNLQIKIPWSEGKQSDPEKQAFSTWLSFSFDVFLCYISSYYRAAEPRPHADEYHVPYSFGGSNIPPIQLSMPSS